MQTAESRAGCKPVLIVKIRGAGCRDQRGQRGTPLGLMWGSPAMDAAICWEAPQVLGGPSFFEGWKMEEAFIP